MIRHRQYPREGRLFGGALVVLLTLVVMTSQSYGQDGATDLGAEGEVDVAVGVAEQVPIAVADGRAGDGSDGAIGQGIADILRRDFLISGAFEVIPNSTFLPGLEGEGLGSAETDFNGWYNSGAEGLVKIGYRMSGSSLEIDFRLYDVTKAKEIKLTYEKPGATPERYRAATHAFANAVIQYYTGFEGIFGQELLVVRKNKGEKHIYRVGTDGRGLTKVSSGNGINVLPAWGPSGGVMFTSYDSGNPDLVVSSGGSRDTVSSSTGLNTGGDYCSGAGRVALTLSKDDNPEIYTVSSDGSSLTRLTNNGYIDTSPTWSPDCSRIAFVSNRGGSPQIYVMKADGSNAMLVTTAGKYNTSPAWSPKGDKIAFTARDEYNVFDIFTVDPDSKYMERLTQDQGHNEEPVWSSDGRYLAFTSTRSSGSRLFIMTADGRYQTPITEGGGFETPAWSR